MGRQYLTTVIYKKKKKKQNGNLEILISTLYIFGSGKWYTLLRKLLFIEIYILPTFFLRNDLECNFQTNSNIIYRQRHIKYEWKK